MSPENDWLSLPIPIPPSRLDFFAAIALMRLLPPLDESELSFQEEFAPGAIRDQARSVANVAAIYAEEMVARLGPEGPPEGGWPKASPMMVG